MKRYMMICTAIFVLAISATAQISTVTDSIYQAFLRDYVDGNQNSVSSESIENMMRKARYKMLPTQNNNILLKLDTKRGRIWMVQYRMRDQSAMEITIDNYAAVSESSGWNGRFDMYPTNNMYNFLMIDTETGQVYQVQWSFDENKRFVEKIY